MIVFDRNSKSLDIPVGLGNLEVNIVTPVSPVDIVESAVTEANQYTDEQVESALTEAKNYTDEQIEGLDIPNTYVLNLMTNEERVALYEELLQYEQVGAQAPSDDFPAEKYNFYIYRNNGYDSGGGFVPMNFIGIRTGSSAKFVGIVTGYVGRNFKHLTYEYNSTGQGTIRDNWCSVFSLNGQKGALNLKTINNESILGEGNIEITGGTGSSVSYEQLLSAGTEIGQITIDGSATTIYAPAGGGGGGATTGEVQTMIDTAIDTETARTEGAYVKISDFSTYTGDTTNLIAGKLNKPAAGVAGGVVQPNYITAAGVIGRCRVSNNTAQRWNSVVINDNNGQTHAGKAITFHQATTGESGVVPQFGKLPNIEGFTTYYQVTGEETNQISGNQRFNVDSKAFIHIEKISQADYDALVSAGTVSNVTLYMIVN